MSVKMRAKQFMNEGSRRLGDGDARSASSWLVDPGLQGTINLPNEGDLRRSF